MNRILIFILVGLFTGHALADEQAKLPVTLFQLFEKEFPESHEISNRKLDAFGFISKRPDLALQKLKKVFKWTQKTPITIFAADGSVEKETVQEELCVMLVLKEEDARSFAKLTKKVKGKKLVIKLGEDLLSAPEVMMTIESGEFWIRCDNAKEQNRVLESLRHLTK